MVVPLLCDVSCFVMYVVELMASFTLHTHKRWFGETSHYDLAERLIQLLNVNDFFLVNLALYHICFGFFSLLKKVEIPPDSFLLFFITQIF